MALAAKMHGCGLMAYQLCDFCSAAAQHSQVLTLAVGAGLYQRCEGGRSLPSCAHKLA